jgi:hypothetical protein
VIRAKRKRVREGKAEKAATAALVAIPTAAEAAGAVEALFQP